MTYSWNVNNLQTVRFKNELERNITIKLGYANAKIYKCEDDKCPRPMCYKWVFLLFLCSAHLCNMYLLERYDFQYLINVLSMIL